MRRTIKSDPLTLRQARELNEFRPVEPGSPEHLALRLTVEEGKELGELNRDITATAIDPEKRERWKALSERALLYGQEGVEAREFEGLEPRYALLDSDKLLREITWKPIDKEAQTSLYFISYGEHLIAQSDGQPRPKPSRWQRFKWQAEFVAQEALDFLAEIVWRIGKAWRALRHG